MWKGNDHISIPSDPDSSSDFESHVKMVDSSHADGNPGATQPAPTQPQTETGTPHTQAQFEPKEPETPKADADDFEMDEESIDIITKSGLLPTEEDDAPGSRKAAPTPSANPASTSGSTGFLSKPAAAKKSNTSVKKANTSGKKEGSVATPKRVTDPNLYSTKRILGDQSKAWTKDDAFDAAFREFNLAGLKCDVENREVEDKENPRAKLLLEVLGHIDDYYAVTEENQAATDTSLIRTTKEAAQAAAKAYLDGGYTAGGRREHWARKLPAKAKVLASRFVNKHGAVNGSMAGWLATCNRTDLMQIAEPVAQIGAVTPDGDSSGAKAIAEGAAVQAWKVGSDLAKLKAIQDGMGEALQTQQDADAKAFRELYERSHAATKEIETLKKARTEPAEGSIRAKHVAKDFFEEFAEKLLKSKAAEKILGALRKETPTPKPAESTPRTTRSGTADRVTQRTTGSAIPETPTPKGNKRTRDSASDDGASNSGRSRKKTSFQPRDWSSFSKKI